MNYLLDTNVVSEFRKASRADPTVLSWAKTIAVTNLFLSVVTIFEIELGTRRIERRDAETGSLFRRWLELQILPDFEDRILPVDIAVTRRCAGLHVPDPRSQLDELIAATALVHQLVVVTRNAKDFAPMGVQILNPWEFRDARL